MKTRQEKDILMERIIALEIKQAREQLLLKNQFHQVIKEANPLFVIKKTIRDAISAPDTPTDMLHGAVQLTSHLLSKNPLLGLFQKPIKKLMGTVALRVLNKLSPSKHTHP